MGIERIPDDQWNAMSREERAAKMNGQIWPPISPVAMREIRAWSEPTDDEKRRDRAAGRAHRTAPEDYQRWQAFNAAKAAEAARPPSAGRKVLDAVLETLDGTARIDTERAVAEGKVRLDLLPSMTASEQRAHVASRGAIVPERLRGGRRKPMSGGEWLPAA